MGFRHAEHLRAILPNFILLTVYVIERDVPADTRTHCALLSSPYDPLPLLMHLWRPFSRYHTLQHLPKSPSRVFQQRSRPRAMAADSDATSHALSTPDKSCTTRAPRISPLSPQLSSYPSISPFAVSSLATSTTPQARMHPRGRSTPSHSLGTNTAGQPPQDREDFEGFEGLFG
jgi:hypothetical protein